MKKYDKFLNFISRVKRQRLESFIVQCAIFKGYGIMAYAKISEILEHCNFKGKIIGFYTFKGFLSVDGKNVIVLSYVATIGRFKKSA